MLCTKIVVATGTANGSMGAKQCKDSVSRIKCQVNVFKEATTWTYLMKSAEAPVVEYDE